MLHIAAYVTYCNILSEIGIAVFSKCVHRPHGIAVFDTETEMFVFCATPRRAALVHATKQRYLQHFRHFQKCVHRPHGIDVFRKCVHLPHGIAVFDMEMWFLVRAGFHV